MISRKYYKKRHGYEKIFMFSLKRDNEEINKQTNLKSKILSAL